MYIRKLVADRILEYLNESFLASNDYIAPINKTVYRAEHSSKKGNWFAFSKDDAIGYANYGDKLIKRNIGGLKFVNVNKISENGEYFDELIQIYPKLFKIINGDIWSEYEINVGLTEYFNAIKDFLIDKGYSGVFTNKKLSVDYEIYVF